MTTFTRFHGDAQLVVYTQFASAQICLMPTPPPRRRFRLQFSLRAVLLLMLLCGIALNVYRWPWVEERPFVMLVGSDELQYQRQTTFHRDWRAQPVKHGPERVWRNGHLLHEAHFYESELHGPRRAFNLRGLATIEVTYRAGELQGPYRAGDGRDWLWQGSYFEGKQHGPWRVVVQRQLWPFHQPPKMDWFFSIEGVRATAPASYSLPEDPIVIRQNWQHGKMHGRWTWETLGGEVLNTAEYDQNELVLWNGQPIVEQFWEWLRGPDVNDPQLVALLEEAQADEWVESVRAFDQLRYQRAIGDQFFTVRLPTRWRRFELQFSPHPCRTFVAGLCAAAAYDGYRFAYRDGELRFVYADDPGP